VVGRGGDVGGGVFLDGADAGAVEVVAGAPVVSVPGGLLAYARVVRMPFGSTTIAPRCDRIPVVDGFHGGLSAISG
jgi:hypothetical protein